METLIKIQKELKAPKNQYNKFGKYNYRSCEDILEAAKPLCCKNNALLTLSDSIIERNGSSFVEATATFMHGDFKHSVTASAKHPTSQAGMSDSQMTGSASSYARKYALNGLFCIDDAKDVDTDENKDEITQKAIKSSFDNCKDIAEVQRVWTLNKKHQKEDWFVTLKEDAKKRLTPKK